MKKIKILYRKNLKMSEGKIASQSVHAAIGLAYFEPNAFNPLMSVVVLGVSDTKFEEYKLLPGINYVVRDAGYTEIPPGTETCIAFLEEDK